MRVLLISANREPINMITLPLGLASVAAATRTAGHEVELLDLMRVSDITTTVRTAIAGFRPQVIGISVRNIDDQNMGNPLFLLDQAKEVVVICRECSSAPIVLGGAGYSIFPVAALEYLGADMGIQGEGEQVFPELVDRLAANLDFQGLPGLYLPNRGRTMERTFIKNLDALPWPDVSAWLGSAANDQRILLPIQTRRGCPLGCTYCSTPTIEGRLIRKCSPERMADYIETMMKDGFRNFFFTDNTFNLPALHAKDLCRAIIARRLEPSWPAILYPGKIDRELIALMAQAGCKGVSLGFETGSQRLLPRLNKRFTLADVRQTRALLADYGLACMGFLLFGGPGETRESVLESLAFADSLHLDSLKITSGIRIYPHTQLADFSRAAGLISPEDDLLFPRFYFEHGLEEWLPETIREWSADRPSWLVPV